MMIVSSYCNGCRYIRRCIPGIITGLVIFSLVSLPKDYKQSTIGLARTVWKTLASNSTNSITESGTLSIDLVSLMKTLHRKHQLASDIENPVSLSDIRQSALGENAQGKKYVKTKDENHKEFHFITVSSVRGRMGNQMFQIAMLIGTAQRHGYTPFVMTSFPLLRYIDIKHVGQMTLSNVRQFREKRCGTYDPAVERLSAASNWTMDGFFQSWKYFDNAKVAVHESFKVREQYQIPAKDFISNVSTLYPQRPKVCVHVRRGDITSKSSAQRGYSVAGVGYIKRAMAYFRRNVTSPVFIMLSDDIDWCKNHIKSRDVLYSPFYWAGEDMALMSLCDHVIVTSGSFGWWGAWLAGGMVVYFKDFPRPKSWLATQVKPEDYYLPNWVGLA